MELARKGDPKNYVLNLERQSNLRSFDITTDFVLDFNTSPNSGGPSKRQKLLSLLESHLPMCQEPTQSSTIG